MAHDLAGVLFLLAGVGLTAIAVQVRALARHVSRRPEPAAGTPTDARAMPKVSILKPLCGVDDELFENLASFAQLDYAHYEVLLGVRDTRDPAYPIACRAALRWPDRMRVVIQHGEPGLNPKVNQLITLAERARHDVLVINDSSVRVEPAYLRTLAACLQDPNVGLVAFPVAGIGAETTGAVLDNAYMASVVSTGMVAANKIARRPLVVGKSMAMRRSDLHAVGGLDAVKNVLAEDHVLGQLVFKQLKKQIAVAPRPVFELVRTRSLPRFFARYTRWGTIQRRSVGLPMYFGVLMLNPVFFATLAVLIAPRPSTAIGVVACVLAKAELERTARRVLGVRGDGLRHLLLVPVKDMLLVLTWVIGLVRNEVSWRGNRLAVLDGTVLVPIDAVQDALGERELA